MSSWKFPDFPLGNIPPHVTVPNGPNPGSSFFTSAKSSISTSANLFRGPNSSANISNNLNSEQARQEYNDDDPRNIRRLRQAGKEKSSKENLLHSMVREFLAQEGFYIPTSNLATGAVPRSTANSSAVAAYVGRVGQGPSPDLPLFSWEHSVSHAWNVAVIRVLNQKFRNYVTDKGLSKLILLLGPTASTSIPVTDINRALDEAGDVEKLIRDKLEYQQGLLRRAQRKVHSLQEHTESEIGNNLKEGLKTARTRARRQERKRNLYLRRAAIIDNQLRREAPELWEQINLVFAHFTEDGMSSDETEIEKGFGAPKLLRRVRKLWLSPEITQIFHYIDNHYDPRTITGTLKKGSAPLKRERDSHKCNMLAFPVPNLPINFYSNDVGEDRIMTLDPKPEFDLSKIPSQMDIDT